MSNPETLPRDLSGFPYRTDEHTGHAYRVTECCAAASTFTGDGAHVCRACYEEVDYAYGDVAHLVDGQTPSAGFVYDTITGTLRPDGRF